MTSIYVCIGNSDDKLTQADWSLFFANVRATVERHADRVLGAWHSLPDEPWQNACFSFAVTDPNRRELIKMRLAELARDYRQDWISWTEAETESIKP